MQTYRSIDDLMTHETGTIQGALNAQELYRGTVQELGYQRITIGVLREGALYKCWTSFNGADGKIERIVEGHHRVEEEHRNLYTEAEETALLEIAQNVERIQEHPLWYVPRYMFRFTMNAGVRMAIVRCATSPRILKNTWRLLHGNP